MVFKHGETLKHAFADGDGWHHDNELVPAIAFVHLEHGLDIDVGLTRTRFHLDVQAQATEVAHQFGWLLDVLAFLNLTDVVEQLLVVQLDVAIAVAGVFLIEGDFTSGFLA